MTSHLVEIYLDSYDSEPFVTEMSDDSAIDSSVCTWLKSRTGKNVNIEHNSGLPMSATRPTAAQLPHVFEYSWSTKLKSL